jgi:hypothetical protein
MRDTARAKWRRSVTKTARTFCSSDMILLYGPRPPISATLYAQTPNISQKIDLAQWSPSSSPVARHVDRVGSVIGSAISCGVDAWPTGSEPVWRSIMRRTTGRPGPWCKARSRSGMTASSCVRRLL